MQPYTRSTILVVDDSPGDFLLLREYLELETGQRFDCVHLASYEDFRRYIEHHEARPQVVLIDCEDPAGDGLDKLREAVLRLPNTPVLGMGQQLMGAAARGALETGIAGFLCKSDLNPARLAQAIDFACANERRMRSLVQRAHYDALTGLANRSLLDDRITHALQRCQRSGEHTALLMIDLDDFKQINDSFGHDVGDRYLRAIATAIRGAVRDSDTVARLGGDEFAVLIEGLRHAEAALQIAAKLIELTTATMRIDRFEILPSMSIGVSLFTPDSSRFSADWLCKAADTALYRAKAQGKNRYCVFTDELDVEMVSNLDLDHALRMALERDELRLRYQPIITAEGGRIIALEALVRWQHPVRGLLRPDGFLPALEKLGFMSRAGMQVTHKAVQDFAAWRLQFDHPVDLHINISAAQITGAGFAEFLGAELAASEVPPERVCLELTETLLFDSSPALQREFDALATLGVRFAIDDFGSGFGSYDYLRRFPVSGIKVDRGLVAGIAGNAVDRAIVRSIVGLARELGIDVTAEGIETVDQMRLLCQLGAPALQGFLFYEPLSSQEIGRLVEAHDSPFRRPSVTVFNAGSAVA
ncbi:MAG: putative bifunctional diguanylate cyclase/phosphodiesterase [Gammaproteobacteria bacterium]